MTTHSQPVHLSPLSDPVSLGKIPILLVPVHLDGSLNDAGEGSSSSLLTGTIYEYWTNLIRSHSSLRGDELSRPRPSSSTPTSSSTGHGHGHASYSSGVESKYRFFPFSSNGTGGGGAGGSISFPRGTAAGGGAGSRNVHLTYPSTPPARHLYPLGLLRMTLFPLIVIGITVDDREYEQDIDQVDGYEVDSKPNGKTSDKVIQGDGKEEEEEEKDDDDGDLGHVSTPTAPTFQHHNIPNITSTAHKSFQQQPHPRLNKEDQFATTLEDLFPPTSPFPLVKRLIVVPPFLPRSPNSPRKQSKSTSHPRSDGDGEVRFAPTEGAESFLANLLGEVVSELLGELGDIATALETPAGLKTLSATLLPSLTSTLPTHLENVASSSRSRSRESTDTLSRPSSTSDGLGGMGISLTRALTPGGRPTSIQPASLPPIQTSISPTPPVQPASSNPFRRSTALTSPFTRTSSSASTISATSPSPINTIAKYTSAPLAGVAGGRLLKLLGDMYLLSGMYADAIKCFDDAAERTRSVGDVLWEAMAREGRAVAGIGEAWEARDGSTAAQPFSTSPIPVEILSHFLSALACLSRSPLPYPPTILSPSPQALSGSLNIPAPTTSNPANIGTGEGLLAYLHTGLNLRISHFDLLIWAAGGWGSIALSSLMTHTLPRSFPAPIPHHESDPHTRHKRARTLGFLSTQSQITRASILGYAEQALGPHHQAMTKTEQLTVHVEAVWLSRWLSLPRKEIAYTREIVKRLAIMVIEGREETRRLGTGGFPSRSNRSPVSSISAENKADAAAAVGLGLGMSVPAPSANTQAVAIRRKESTEGNAGIVSLFENICNVAGIDLLSPGSDHHHRHSYQSTNDIDNDEKGLTRSKKFGWPEIQVEIMKEGIAIVESLPDHPSIVRLAISTLNGLYGYLNSSSQSMLSKMYTSALSTVRRRGLEFGGVPWWIPGRMVLSLEIASLAPNRIPIEHSPEEIVVKEGKDPFLYNPRLKAAEAGKTVLVVNEQVDIFVIVRNPFSFDLEIQDLSILTSGVPFLTSPLPLTLPASSIQTVRVVGNAPTSGLMQVRGVSIRLVDGSNTDFLLPIIDDKDKQKREKRRSRISGEMSKVKRTGLDARFDFDHKINLRDGGEQEDKEKKWLECKVVEEQPLAWIKRTNLTHGTVMLYDGECSTIRITLENSSSVPIDFIKLSFSDTTQRDALQAVQEGELSPEFAYQVEWDQLNRPVFTWEGEGEGNLVIPPGGRTTLSVKCMGKVGCTDGTIRIDYGYLKRKSTPNDTDTDTAEASTSNAFHTRQITFPVLFTVYHTIECHSLDLIRLDGGEAPSSSFIHKESASTGPGASDVLKRILEEENDEDHCLLSLSVRNVYGVPFQVSLSRNGSETDVSGKEICCTRLVPPGATERLIIPLPRQTISEETLNRPIPSISTRQYIVDKNKKSKEQISKDLKIFWLRDILLKFISVKWLEPGSSRRGDLSIKNQFIHPDLLDVFQMDNIDIRIDVSPRNDSGEREIRAMDFIDIRVTITNRSERPFRPFVHLEPISSSITSWTTTTTTTSSSANATNTNKRPLSLNPQQQQQQKNILLDGSSSCLLPVLNPKQSDTFNLGGIMLVSGQFGFRAAVEIHNDLQVGNEVEVEVEGRVFFSPVSNVNVI